MAGPMGGAATVPKLVPRRIPFADIDRWAQRHGIAGERFRHFLHLIEKMDAAALAVRRELDPGDGQSAVSGGDDGSE